MEIGSAAPRRPARISVVIQAEIALAVAGLLAACAGTGSPSTSSPTGSNAPNPATAAASPFLPTLDVSNPVGVIAVGHSGLTGEGTGTAGEAVPEKSWATGTLEAVNSVYLRLVAVRPETEGHAANTARGGASASQLAGMVDPALELVPVPALAIIQTIDNDIHCDGRDATRLEAFGESVRVAIERIVLASPNVRVLVVGQLGRPRAAFLEDLVEAHPEVKASATGVGRCDAFGPDGELVQAHLDYLTAIIDSFEAEQARVCAAFPQCATDAGVRAAYIDKLENFSGDWAHLNVRGQAEEAELIWPVVGDLLGL